MMYRIQIKYFLVGLFLALAIAPNSFAQSAGSRTSDDSEIAPVKAQASRLVDLEIITRAEERAEALRAKVFDLQIQELDLQAYLEELDYRLTPDSIQRAALFISSVRPADELRNGLRTRLENEKARVNKQLELLAASRERLEAAISRADAEVERLRQRLSLP